MTEEINQSEIRGQWTVGGSLSLAYVLLISFQMWYDNTAATCCYSKYEVHSLAYTYTETMISYFVDPASVCFLCPKADNFLVFPSRRTFAAIIHTFCKSMVHRYTKRNILMKIRSAYLLCIHSHIYLRYVQPSGMWNCC